MDFITIEKNTQAEVIEKKSKFIANLFPIESIEEAEEMIKETKKKYHDARHNCIAYRVQQENQIWEKSSDDGEPSGTAGAPMLNILQKQNLVNVLIVVTRYFGGVLLGTGGLVRAYSDSLLKAIEKSNFIQKCEGIEMQVTLEYGEFDLFKYYCKNNDILLRNVEYHEVIRCNIQLEDRKKEKLKKDFENKKIILIDMKEIAKKVSRKVYEKSAFTK